MKAAEMCALPCGNKNDAWPATKICDGKATQIDLDRLEELAVYVKKPACGTGRFCTQPIVEYIKTFQARIWKQDTKHELSELHNYQDITITLDFPICVIRKISVIKRPNMNTIPIIINDKKLDVDPGKTILEVCRENDIEILTMCHLKV